MISRLLLLFFMFVPWLLFSQSNNLPFRQLTVDQGLPHTDATSVLQDKNGFIWISTYAGISRFDGYEVKNFVSKSYPLNNVYLNRINNLHLDKDKIWMASQGGIAYFDLKEEKIVIPKYEKDSYNLNFQNVMSSGRFTYGVAAGKLYIFETTDGITKKIPVKFPLSNITSIAKDKAGDLWIAAEKGLFKLSGNTRLTAFQLTDQNGRSFDNLTFVGFGDQQNLLVGKSNAFAIVESNKLSEQNIQLTSYPFSENKVELSTDEKSDISYAIGNPKTGYWVGSPSGLKKFDYTAKKFVEPPFLTSLLSSHVNHLLVDRSGSLWVSTYGGGVNYVDLSPKKFQTLRFEQSNYIRAIYEDPTDGNLWVGTRTKGLIYYDFQTKKQRSIQHQINNSASLVNDNIRSLTKDKKGRLWVGTENGISILEGKTVVKNLQNNSQTPNALSNNVIYSMSVDVFGQVWAGSWHNGVNRIYEENGTFKHQEITAGPKGLSDNKVSFVFADPTRPEVFVGTLMGLNHFFLNADGSINKINRYLATEKQPKSISSNFIWPILRADQKTLWVGTIGGGLNKLTMLPNGNYEAEAITTQEGLPSNDVESLIQDNDGNLWIGGRGLSMYNPETGKITNYDSNDGLQSNVFKIGSAFKGRDGRMYFGGVNGINYFYPEQIRPSTYKTSIVLTNLLINNKIANVQEGELPASLQNLESLTLNYLQNNFIINFASLDYANTEKCRYRYKLVGLNDEWVETSSNNRSAAFSNLDYGDYTFMLQSTNHDGIWMKETKTLDINITPPWWKSTFAKICYTLLILGFLYLIYQYQLRWFKLKQQLQIKGLEEQKKEELQQMRIQFFTNISHELRTPLSLILSPTERLIYDDRAISPDNRQNLYKVIRRNATRLLSLVNELLEFRKAETGMMKLKASEVTMIPFIEDICSEFQDIAVEKNITFTQKLKDDKQWIDPNVYEKIVVNLLSNAFKYTPTNAEITIELTDTGNYTYQHTLQEGNQKTDVEYDWLRVIDKGVGISPDSLNHIFDRFYRVTEAEQDKLPGSGIGLTFVRSLVMVHKGVIRVSTELGKGTEFLVGIPKGKEYLNPDEIASAGDYSLDDSAIRAIEINQQFKDEAEKLPISTEAAAEGSRYKMLIVEDNSELRHFLTDSFMGSFHIIEAVDGAEGLKMVREELPDVIVSDVMMPVMDGFELCQAVKSDIETSHTPFILLTAKNSDEDRISGSEVGADAYISKPFSLKLLQLTIQNLLESRKKLKEMYAHDIFIEAREMGTNKRDKEFIDNLISIIEEHLDDTNLDVEMICNEVGMSRTKLYSKIQSLTGQSVGEFVRKLRLKKAAQIIVSEDVSITEVMERIGIQSQSYFTKAFKKEFGKTPTNFLHDYIVEKELMKS